jgi:hypothetical protein
MKKILCFIVLTGIALSSAVAQSYSITYVQDGGNPGGVNSESYSVSTGWTEISTGGQSSNEWTAPQAIPFPFAFYGNPVSYFMVSSNGVLTFDTATTILPGDNGPLPSTGLPDSSIAFFWDAFTSNPPVSTADDIDVKTFGTAPNRQLWVRYYGYELNGNSNVHSAVVLEETTNKIYVVDLYSTNNSGLSATVGVQATASLGVDAGFNLTISGNGTGTPDNDYYEFQFVPAGTCFPPANLAVKSFDSDEVMLVWDAAAAGSTFEVEYGPLGFTPGTGQVITGITDTFRIVSGLDYYTQYDFYVSEDCTAGGLSQQVGPVTQLTAIAEGWRESFSGTYVPLGWYEAQGDVANPTSFTSTTTSGWDDDEFASLGTNIAANELISGTTNDEWLITYSMDLPSGHNLALEFDLALTVSGFNLPGTLGSDDSIMVVVSADDGQTWNRTDAILVLDQNSVFSANTGIHYALPLTAYSGLIKVGFYAESNVTNESADLFIDNLSLKQIGSCPTPHSLLVSNTSTTGFDLSWNANGATNFNIIWGPKGFDQATTTATPVSASSYSITGLTPYTEYDVYLWSVCAGGNSDTVLLTSVFTAIQPAWLENFEGATFVPAGWEERSGVIGNPTDFTSFGTALWTSDDFGNDAALSEGARVIMSATTAVYDDWLITPLIDLGTGNLYQLEFDAALTSSTSTAQEAFDADDSLKVVISTDGGLSWSNANALFSLSAGSEPSNTGSHYIIDLSSYSGMVKLAFLVKSATGGGNAREIGIDNVQVRVAPNCQAPFGLSGTGSLNSVVVSWNVLSPAASYTIEYGTAGFALGTGTQITGVLDTFATIPGLLFNTGYDIYVQADCGVDGTSSFGGPLQYLTPCDVFVAPFAENFDGWRPGTGTTTTGDSISVCWSRDPATTSAYSWRVRNGSGPSTTTGPNGDRNGTGNYIFTESSSSGTEARLVLPLVDVSALTTPEISFFYHMYGATIGSLYVEVSDGVNTYTNLGLISGAQQTASGDPYLQQIINLAPYPLASDTVSITIVGVRGTSTTGDIAIDEVEVREALTCPLPTGLGVANITAGSALLSWNTGSGISNLEWGPSGFQQGSGTGTIVRNAASPFNLNGLSPNTSYDFYIQDSCAAFPNSAWIGPITFTTRCTSILNGVYTVGGPVGPNNFATLDSAISVLNDCGIDGPVVFEIAAGTYNETGIINEIVGASAVNTITFVGAGAGVTTITHDGSVNTSTLALNGADYVSLRKLTISNTKNASEAVCVWLTNNAEHNSIDSCSFFLPNTDSETSHIFAGASITSITSSSNGQNANDLHISHAHFDGGNNNIIFAGSTTDVNLTANLTIEHCVFTGFDDVALSISDVNGLNILHDSINSPIGRYVFDLDDISNFVISNNYLRNLNTVATFQIFNGNVDPDVVVSNNSVISNNIIHSTGNYSLFLSQTEYTDIVHNTMFSDASDNLYLSSVDHMTVVNNIMCAPKGLSVFFSGGAPAAATNTIDYNLYFPLRSDNFPATYIPAIADGAARYTLAEWQIVQSAFDANTKGGNPQFGATGNFKPIGFLADNSGTPVTSASTDYNGINRSVTTPDIGAHEFSAVSCPEPVALDVTNVAGPTADIYWTGIGSAYDLEWGELGFALGTGTSLASANDTATLAGLTGGVTYSFYVRTNCTSSTSGWAGPFSFVASCGTPLSGVYTIDQSLPSSATNFSSLKTASLALSQCGISGPVTFNVAAGTYQGTHIFSPVPGASATNTITINGGLPASVLITSDGREIVDNYGTVVLDGADFFTFKNLSIANTSVSDAFGVILTNEADHNSFINCSFILPATTTGADVIGLSATNSLVNDNTTGNNASYLTIDSCHFFGGEKGITVDGSSSGFNEHNLRIANSTFDGIDETVIDINEMDTVLIEGNTIGNITDAGTSYAIEMDDVNNFIIRRNTIIAADEGISIDDGNDGNNPSVRSEISNNMIIAGADHAMDIIDVTNVNIYHNSLVGEPAIEIDDHDAMSIKNNIFYGRASEAFLSADALGSSVNVEIDYNLYYSSDTAATYPIDIDGTDYSTLAAWVAADASRNANSVEGDPIFISVAGDLHVEGPLANEAGDNSVGILIDIDGETRPGNGATIVDMGADEFVPATCLSPDSIVQLSSTDVSVELDWATGGASNWQIQYGAPGFTLGTGTTAGVLAKPYTLPGLASYTCYDVYVRDSCAVGETSRWSGPFKACTDWSCLPVASTVIAGDTFFCKPDSVRLTASGPSSTLWFNNNVFYNEGDLRTDTLFADSTFYYVGAEPGGPQGSHVGPLTNIASNAFGTSNFVEGILFTVHSPMRLDSVVLLCDGPLAGNINIYKDDGLSPPVDIVQDIANAERIHRVRYDLPAAGEYQVPVDVVLAPGDYFINLSYFTGYTGVMFRATSGGNFPYEIDNMVTLTSNLSATASYRTDRYYYLFDWVVSGVCLGDEDSVQVVVDSSSANPTASFTMTVGTVTATNATVDFNASASASSILSYEWNFGDGTTGTGVAPQHIYTFNGTYNVELVVITDCGSDTLVQQLIIGGINLPENTLSNSLSVYPNPVSSQLSVSFKTEGAQEAILQLLDATGKIVYQKDLPNINGVYDGYVGVQDLPNGLYFLRINAGSLQTSRRVIISH